MTLQKHSLFEEQEYSKDEAIKKYAREFKNLIEEYKNNYFISQAINDNNRQVILDSSSKDCLNRYGAKINEAGMSSSLPTRERTVAQALRDVRKEIDRLYEARASFDEVDVQCALESYLSNLDEDEFDEPCNEENLEGIAEAVRCGIDFDIKNPDFFRIAQDMEEWRADQRYAENYGCPDEAYDNCRDEYYEAGGR